MNNIPSLLREVITAQEPTASDTAKPDDKAKLVQNDLEHYKWLNEPATAAMLKAFEESVNAAAVEIANLCVQGGSDVEIRVRGVRMHTLLVAINLAKNNKNQ